MSNLHNLNEDTVIYAVITHINLTKTVRFWNFYIRCTVSQRLIRITPWLGVLHPKHNAIRSTVIGSDSAHDVLYYSLRVRLGDKLGSRLATNYQYLM